MKKKNNASKGLIRGRSSAFVLSAVIHAIILFGAGVFAIYKIVVKEEIVFVPPPPIDRPEMELKKPRVKVRNATKPSAAKRITTSAVQTAPDIQLPEISGIGSGLSGGIGGFEIVPQSTDVSMFGDSVSAAAGNDFEGTLYVLNRDREGKDLGLFSTSGHELDTIRQFLENDWSPFVFHSYYRSPKKRYATHFMIPTVPAIYGPRAFGVDCDPDKTYPSWVVHYKGKISSKKGGRYRFWGSSAQILLVRIKGELVLNASFFNWQGYLSDWQPTDPEHLTSYRVGGMASIGHWFTLEPGEVVEMEVLFGNMKPPRCSSYLVIEDEAEQPYYTYREDFDNGPRLPVFRTAEIPEAVKNEIKYLTYADTLDLDGGEIFNVH